MILFFCKDLSGDSALLEEDEFQHCIKVLRHKVGDTINLSDGAGTKALAILTDIKKRAATLSINNKQLSSPKPGKIHLYVAPPKNRTRWEWLLEKSVELGVDQITALNTSRTERSKINTDRTNKIIRSAALQSLRNFHPSYEGQLPFAKLVDLSSSSDKYLAHYAEHHPQLSELSASASSVDILIGPEGDFTPKEIRFCIDSGYKGVNISGNRLRTETAAITVISILKSIGY